MDRSIQLLGAMAMVALVAAPVIAPHPDDVTCYDPPEREFADARGHDHVCVDVVDFSLYDPAIVQVDPGTTVIWRNPVGNLVHTVTFTVDSTGGTFDQAVAPGDHVQHTFTAEGKTYYDCRIGAGHTATMHGAVVVGDLV